MIIHSQREMRISYIFIMSLLHIDKLHIQKLHIITLFYLYNNESNCQKHSIEVIHGQSRMKILNYHTDNKYNT